MYEAKAAMLMNFAKFVDWPETAFANGAAPLVIAVAGRDPFGATLDETLRDKTAGGRPIALKRVRTGNAGGATFHILFVALSERGRAAEIVEALNGRPVLTVSDIGGFARLGGVIELRLRDRKVGFEVNLEAAQRHQLRISSRLLTLAAATIDGGPGR